MRIVNSATLQEYIARLVHVAHSGGEAFEIAKELRPEVCILDIGMPDLNGYQLAERIRREA
jgi:CheY-like chemotaxis protein